VGLIQSKGLEPESIVVEYNYEVLPREKWDSVVLKETIILKYCDL